MKKLTSFLFSLPLAVVVSNTLAATIDLDRFGDGVLSTTETTGVNLTAPAAPSLPADSTFTAPMNTGLSSGQGKFFRYNFVLPPGYSNLSFTFEAGVNDEFAVYLNDSVIAIQDDTSVANFNAPLPGFVLNPNGTSSDTSGGKLDFLSINQAQFLVGNNELTVFATDTGAGGSFFDMTATLVFDAPGSTISPTRPIPTMPVYGLVAAILGLLLLAARQFRRP